jgi:hypothetical protein
VLGRRIWQTTAGVLAAVALAVPAPAWADPAAPTAPPTTAAVARAVLPAPDAPLDRLVADPTGAASAARPQAASAGLDALPNRVADLPRPAAATWLEPALAPAHGDPSAVLRVPGRGPPGGTA